MRLNSKVMLTAGCLLACLVCGSVAAQEKNPAPTAPSAPQAPNAQQAQPAPTYNLAIRWKQFDYTCEGGAKLTFYLHDETGKVRFKDKTYVMKQVTAADGARYSDGKVVWWSKGDGGFLQTESPEGNGEMLAKDCRLEKHPAATERVTGSVSGTVSYLARMALPPEAMIEVQLQDISRADAAATIIATDVNTLGDRQVPVPFELKFDAAKIDPQHTYAVIAQILAQGEVRYVNDKAYRVLTQGNPSHVEIMMKPVGGQESQPSTSP